MLVETPRGIFILPFLPFFQITKIFSSLHHHCQFLCDCSANRLSSSGSSDYVPLRRNEIRSILGDDCPLSSVQIEGPNSS